MSEATDTPKSIRELNSDLFEPEEDDRFSNPQEARKKAMDYLARREYGRDELVSKLANAGYQRQVADAAVTQLQADGLQDDRRFVEGFAQSRVNQGKGPVKIQAELAGKRLKSGIVDEVLDEMDVDWFELASEVRLKKFGPDQPDNFKDKARQMRFLQSRGFEMAHIQSAVASDDFD